MRILVAALLLISAHFTLTAIIPAEAGKAWLAWPFATDTRPVFSFLGGFPNTPTQLLSIVAGSGFILAFMTLFGWVVPANWWLPLIIISASASIILYILYFGLWSLIPIALDLVLLWGVLIQHWSVAHLQAS